MWANQLHAGKIGVEGFVCTNFLIVCPLKIQGVISQCHHNISTVYFKSSSDDKGDQQYRGKVS